MSDDLRDFEEQIQKTGVHTERLAGEATPGHHGFVTSEGEPTEARHAIFPILKELGPEEWELIGTGFFIAPGGIFVTAKHVLEEVFDSDGNVRCRAFAAQSVPPDGDTIYRDIVDCSWHPTADVGVGKLIQMNVSVAGGPARPVPNPNVKLWLEDLQIGDHVATYAYPKWRRTVIGEKQVLEIAASFFEGTVQDFCPEGRGSGKMQHDCYRTDMFLHGGSSGGPVFNKREKTGYVVAINSSSFGGAEDISFVSPIKDILDLTISNCRLTAEEPLRDMTLRELVDANVVKVVGVNV